MSVWSTCTIYPSMAILRRYAAMFRVGTSFIFSSIKSRSASVTLNLICTVLFRPSMRKCSFPFRGFGKLPNKHFADAAAGQSGQNTEVGTRFLCLLRKFFLTSYYGAIPNFAKLPQKKNAAIRKKITTLPKAYSVLSRTFLFALFFDFRNLFRRCGYNPYALIAHGIKQCVELPPFCIFSGGRI